MKIISDNRRAHYDYFIEDKFEAGLELQGWEVKSCREGKVNLQECFVYLDEGEAWLKNAHFSKYNFGDVKTQIEKRDRKLLLHSNEISKIHTAVKAKGQTCIATKVYFNKRGRVKIEIALAKGKHTYDKRATIKERDIARETKKEVNN